MADDWNIGDAILFAAASANNVGKEDIERIKRGFEALNNRETQIEHSLTNIGNLVQECTLSQNDIIVCLDELEKRIDKLQVLGKRVN